MGSCSMGGFETRFERLELKYLIDEVTADRVRRDIEPYCRPDPHNPSESGCCERPGQLGYPVYSLYLDSPGLAFYHAKMRGDPERLKLRIRTYSSTSAAVLELKRRVADIINKTRVVVNRKEAYEAAMGLATPVEDSPRARHFLNEFALVVARAGADPTLCIRYEREAYASTVDEYARVTFDRRIGGQRTTSWDLAPDPWGWCEFDHHWPPDRPGKPVVLELKCHSSVPHWISDLVRRNGLIRTAFSKYCIGIHVTGRHYYGDRAPLQRPARLML